MSLPASVQSLCDEFEVRVVHKNKVPRLGETRAVGTLRKLIDRHGMDEARIVMRTLVETENNKHSLEAETIGAAADLLRARREQYEADPSRWFAVWDRCPVAELQAIANDLRGFVPVRAALGGLIAERLWRAYGPLSVQLDMLDDRRMYR